VKQRVNVSLVQFAPARLDREQNARRMAEITLVEGREHGADLVVFPELASTGYLEPHPDEVFAKALQQQSEPIPGPTSAALGAAARAVGAHVIAGVSETHPTIPHVLFNSAVLVGPDGALIGVQRKLHPALIEKNYYNGGSSIEAFDTEIGKIGMNVCYDTRFPEMARVQALRGAEIIVSIWAWAEQGAAVPAGAIRDRVATRAMENALFFLACNRTGTEGGRRFVGRSAVAGPSGEVLAEADSDAEIAVHAVLAAETLAEQRAYITVFNDRRPELYGPIVDH
jgi:predicted amidohydrolase